ncbi:MAG: dTDP-glucose 4,6-dehydratase [bacterium]|nr:dTDP-glucose 4,6-dehydratase [bacterium]
MIINTACRACKSIKLTKVIDLGMQPLANSFLTKEKLDLHEAKYPLEVYFCEDCNLVQLIHVVDKSVLFEDYIYFSSGMPKLSDHFMKYAEDVINRFLRNSDDLVVEMGSNDGILLQFFKNKNYRVLGVDPAKNIAKVACERGIETIADFFSESLAKNIALNRGKAKVIMGNNVVAHINDYQDLCSGVKELLAPDGVFVFEAPYLVDMFENLAFDTIYHEHLNFLAICPLVRLFQRFGLEIFDVQIVSAQGKSIRVFVGNAGTHKIENSVNECIQKEEVFGLDKKESYFELAREIKRCKEKVLNSVLEFKRIGKSISAYGAPAKGNTLLNYYGIGSDILDFALDELPSKQGLYTPGTHIPVFSKEYADVNKPDYYLLLAWNYLNVILEKEKEFLNSGGAFILPNGEIISRENKVNHNESRDKKIILVTGGCGFIGSNFIRHLYNKYPEYRIFNLDLLTYAGNQNNLLDIEQIECKSDSNQRRYHFLYGDICDVRYLDIIFQRHNFDMVINFAAETHVDRSIVDMNDFIRTNIGGVRSIIEAVRKYKVPRLVHISTDEIYGDIKEGYSHEESPLRPSNPYSSSKAAADLIVQSFIRTHNVPAVIVRGSNNYGPYQYPEKLIPLAISNIIEGKKIPIHGTGGQVRSWVHVSDFCSAIDEVAHKSPDNEIYNVSGEEKTNLDILNIIAKSLVVNLDDYKEHVNDRPGADTRYAVDASKLSNTLGWSPVHTLEKDLQDVVGWYLKNDEWWREIKKKTEFIEHYNRQQKADYY